MKKIVLHLVIVMMTKFVSAQYIPSEQRSAIVFKIGNFGFDVTGKFTGIHGVINFDPQNLASDNFDVTVDAGSVNTDNSLRDKHLKGESYFDITDYPNIHFISTSITSGTNNGVYMLLGKLTIKNIVREIRFPFTATSSGEGYIFKGSFKIKRKDF